MLILFFKFFNFNQIKKFNFIKMQKEKKAESNNNLGAESLLDLENEILYNKNPKSNKNYNYLDFSELQANDKENHIENSIEENSKKANETKKLLLSTKRNRTEIVENQSINEPNKKTNPLTIMEDNSHNSNNYKTNYIKENNETILSGNGINNKTNQNNSSIPTARGIECPYLGTIKRHLLDFDFEKVCSISLSNLNVYACLVCGKYYQGRGKNTHAYLHSLQEDHHLFINLNDEKIICLPEGYEVLDNSLKDIKLNLKPVYTEAEIAEIDKEKDVDEIYSSALDGTEYIPGCIGLNNIKKTDYVNVIIQALCRVAPLRDYFMRYDDITTNLVWLNLYNLFLLYFNSDIILFSVVVKLISEILCYFFSNHFYKFISYFLYFEISQFIFI